MSLITEFDKLQSLDFRQAGTVKSNTIMLLHEYSDWVELLAGREYLSNRSISMLILDKTAEL